LDVETILLERAFRRLAQKVIFIAAADAIAGDTSARAWLSNQETADTWLSIAELQRDCVLAWIEAGCPDPKRQRAAIFSIS
jgi:hypothetical protein